MRFIHAADIHLDSPLHGLANYPDAPVDVLRTSTRRAFENLVTRAIEEQVDFMVIAGDLYDGTWRDHNTGIQSCKQMGQLRTKGIPAYVLFGNHDNFSEARNRLKTVIDQVVEDADVTVISRRDAPDAVVMSYDHYSSLMETVHLLSSPANAAHLSRSIAQLTAGQAEHRDLIEEESGNDEKPEVHR
jgi:prevent-host-death family protein